MFKFLSFFTLIPGLLLAWPQGVEKPLSNQDVITYRQLFQAQRSLNINQVPTLIKNLDNQLLIGHVSAVRLLHPRTKTPFITLKSWLELYPDHPQALEIYTLARKRNVTSAPLAQPKFTKTPTAFYKDWDLKPSPKSAQKPGKRYNEIKSLVDNHLKAKRYKKAATLLTNPTTRAMLGGEKHTELSLKIARNLMKNSDFSAASALLKTASHNTSTHQKEALWLAGFTAYRAGLFTRASQAFKDLLHNTHTTSRTHTRAAWWLSRTYTHLNKPDLSRTYLKLAAQNPTTFYGQLAHQHLGASLPLPQKTHTIKTEFIQNIKTNPALKRMLALAQIGEYNLAQRELQTIYHTLPRTWDESLLHLAQTLHLPNMAMVLSKNIKQKQKVTHISGLYPLPTKWAPYNGFAINPAYIYAIMRQESMFDPTTLSSAGARGLMQLMPSTANYMMKQANLNNIPSWLLELPGLNVTLGQQYITYLQQRFNNNPVLIFAAYNAGPGNVKKWQNRAKMQNIDPITFIESIPFQETRTYVKRVMTNFWLYQHRLNQPSPTRMALANQQWPNSQVAQAFNN